MGINLTPVFRALAAAPLPRLQWYYVMALTLSQLCFFAAIRQQNPTMAWLGWAFAAVPFSALFAVIAFYRDDDLLAASVLMAVMTAVGAFGASALVSLVFTFSIGPALLMLGLAPIALFVRLVVAVPVLMLIFWLARKGRRFLAPETVDDERVSAA